VAEEGFLRGDPLKLPLSNRGGREILERLSLKLPLFKQSLRMLIRYRCGGERVGKRTRRYGVNHDRIRTSKNRAALFVARDLLSRVNTDANASIVWTKNIKGV
jgi:hypothetical protein